MVSSLGIRGYEQFKSEMKDFFINELKALPHWGKYVPSELDYEKLYGENFIEFKNALARWCEAHHLKIDKLPFLNEFFCRILKFPISPIVHSKEINLSIEKTSSNDLIKATLPLVKTDCENGEKLRNQLLFISSCRITKAKQTLFQSEDTKSKKKSDDKDPTCCLII